MRERNLTNNYFKLTHEYHRPRYIFFNDTLLYSVEDAYVRATEFEDDGWRVAVYSPVHCQRGIWDRFPVVGHRRVRDIQEDLKNSCTDKAKADELIAAIGNKAMYTEAYADELRSILTRFAHTAGGELRSNPERTFDMTGGEQ